MNRRAVAAVLTGLGLIGCAQGRSALPGLGPIDPSSALAPLPNLNETINTGMTPVDPSTRRAKLEVAPGSSGRRRATAPPTVGGPAPTAPDSAPADPQFAVPAAGAVVPKPIPDEPPPVGAPPPDPGPAPEAQPAASPAAERRTSLEAPASPEPRAPAESPAPAAEPAPSAAEPAPSVEPPAPATEEPRPATKGIDPASLPDLPIPDAPPASTQKPGPPPEPSRPVADDPLPPLGSNPAGPRLQPTVQIVRTAAPTDPAVKPASRTTDPSTLRTGPRRDVPVTQIAAVVGKEEITLTQLQAAVKERIGEGVPASKIPYETMNMIARSTLDQLIERALLIQAAKHKLKTDKNWDQMMRAFDRMWRERELPEVLTKYHAADEHELRVILKQHGRSYETLREEFKLKNAAMEFLRAEVLPKTKVDLPEMLAFYEGHRQDFDRPARVTWREIEVKVTNHKDRAEARAKAEAALGRLRRGESFAEVAKALDEGPNAKKGGRWEAAPDSAVVPAVNQTLNTIAPGHPSPLIEGPGSYHIVVVESRRRAGPAAFPEVQDEIMNKLREKKYNALSDAYFQKLRGSTLICSMFDGTASAPSLSNGDKPQGRPAR